MPDSMRYSIISITILVLLIGAGGVILAIVKQKTYLPFRVISVIYDIGQTATGYLYQLGSKCILVHR